MIFIDIDGISSYLSGRYIAIFCLIVNLFLLCDAVDMVDSNKIYYRDDTLIFKKTLPSDAGEITDAYISIKYNNIEIFRESADINGNKVFFEYRIPRHYPSGNYSVGITYIANGKTGKIAEKFQILSRREDRFYAVVFLSPAEYSNMRRTENITVSISLLRGTSPVVDAVVYALLPSGRFLRLEEQGSGIYSSDYIIPYNEKLGKWNIHVTAFKRVGNITYGGESEIGVIIEEVPVEIIFEKPLLNFFSIGDKIPIHVRFSYITGKTVFNPKILFKINNRAVDMNCSSSDCYAEFVPYAGDVGMISFDFEVKDNAGNYGKKIQVIEVGGKISYTIRLYIKYFFLFLIVFSVIFFIAHKRISKRVEEKTVLSRFEENLIEQKRLQNEYFESGNITKEQYDRRIKELSTQMMELQQRLLDMGVKEEVINKIKSQYMED